MNRFITTIFIVFLIIVTTTPAHGVTTEENHIYLNFTRKEVCSNRARKCWPVALGDSSHPTPIVEGPVYILTHLKNGFTWRNPFTGVIYKPGTHNLGKIWIQYTVRNNIDIGFHKTPTPNIPLSKQESKGGCIRMTSADIQEFSDNVRYLDKIYAISQQASITY